MESKNDTVSGDLVEESPLHQEMEITDNEAISRDDIANVVEQEAEKRATIGSESETTDSAAPSGAQCETTDSAAPSGVESETTDSAAPLVPSIEYDMTKTPVVMAIDESEFTDYLKGCKWSPDGSCLLVGTSDKRICILALPEEFYTGDFSKPIPEMKSYLTVKEGGTIYDYCWYPAMNGLQAETCMFATTAQEAPIHLWDSVTGQVRCTCKAINALDEMVTAYSVAFSRDGTTLYAGFQKYIRLFDVRQGGRQFENIQTHKKRQTGQTGIISCFDFHSSESVFAAGSYSKSVAVYDARSGSQSMILEGHSGGVTCIKFSADGNLLFSGGRKDKEILSWDMRQPGQICYIMERDVRTNQRIQFDMDPAGKYIASGNHDGRVHIWEFSSQCENVADEVLRTTSSFQAHQDCVNGCSFHPSLALLATTSGQRSLVSDISSSEDEEETKFVNTENSVKLWWLGL